MNHYKHDERPPLHDDVKELGDVFPDKKKIIGASVLGMGILLKASSFSAEDQQVQTVREEIPVQYETSLLPSLTNVAILPVDSYESDYAALVKALNVLEKKQADYALQRNGYELELADYQAKLLTVDDNIIVLNDKIDALKQELSEVEKEYNVSIAYHAEIIAAWKQTDQTDGAYYHSILSIHDELVALKLAIEARYQEEINALLTEIKANQVEQNQLLASKTALESKYATIVAEYATLQAEAADLRRQLEAWHDTYASLVAENEKKLQDYLDDKATYDAELARITGENTNKKETYEAAMSQYLLDMAEYNRLLAEREAAIKQNEQDTVDNTRFEVAYQNVVAAKKAFVAIYDAQQETIKAFEALLTETGYQAAYQESLSQDMTTTARDIFIADFNVKRLAAQRAKAVISQALSDYEKIWTDTYKTGDLGSSTPAIPYLPTGYLSLLDKYLTTEAEQWLTEFTTAYDKNRQAMGLEQKVTHLNMELKEVINDIDGAFVTFRANEATALDVINYPIKVAELYAKSPVYESASETTRAEYDVVIDKLFSWETDAKNALQTLINANKDLMASKLSELTRVADVYDSLVDEYNALNPQTPMSHFDRESDRSIFKSLEIAHAVYNDGLDFNNDYLEEYDRVKEINRLIDSNLTNWINKCKNYAVSDGKISNNNFWFKLIFQGLRVEGYTTLNYVVNSPEDFELLPPVNIISDLSVPQMTLMNPFKRTVAITVIPPEPLEPEAPAPPVYENEPIEPKSPEFLEFDELELGTINPVEKPEALKGSIKGDLNFKLPPIEKPILKDTPPSNTPPNLPDTSEKTGLLPNTGESVSSVLETTAGLSLVAGMILLSHRKKKVRKNI